MGSERLDPTLLNGLHTLLGSFPADDPRRHVLCGGVKHRDHRDRFSFHLQPNGVCQEPVVEVKSLTLMMIAVGKPTYDM